MTALYLYDDATARTFEPFALTRPISELRAGMLLIRDRWEHAIGLAAAGAVVAPHLVEFEEADAPPGVIGAIPAGAVLANSRCVVPARWSARDADVWVCGGRVAAVRLGADLGFDEVAGGETPLESVGAAGTRVVEVPGRWLNEVWSLIVDLTAQLQDDIARVGPELECAVLPAGALLGGHPVYLERGATVEPMVCLDATAGPILVRRGATIRAFTRLVGPCAIASDALVTGGRVGGCSIGEMSVVCGEISETVILGHANKAHDGFVGHSYLGRWVNLGAGTITSNLKNTYGTVQLWTPRGVRDSGTIKLGTLFGDHVKAGIGLRLTTGSVIGAGSNVYGADMPPKYVPPFSWGEGRALGAYDVEKFLITTRRAMSRRGMMLSDRGARLLRAAHARARDSSA
ncbi:MAG: hypothetical protein M3373_06350 [Gemmatimonadota bacterium]|nr:hypothetical protein [Gemmatimonadota bacterium]